MPAVTMKELLESGVHFGHQTRRWNPRMKPYIFTERGGIYIIDLQQTTRLIDEAYNFVKELAANGKRVLFVGTKKQCQDTIVEEAKRAEMPYVSHRWLGGLLTNYSTISQRIKRMHELRKMNEDGQIELLPTREQMNLRAELRKLEVNLGGVAEMDKLPAAVFIIDPRREAIVVREARKLKIPILALVDTNCNPDEVDFVIPGNDDAIRSCSLIISAIANAVVEGKQLLSEKEMRAPAAAAGENSETAAAPDAERKVAQQVGEAPAAEPEGEAAATKPASEAPAAEPEREAAAAEPAAVPEPVAQEGSGATDAAAAAAAETGEEVEAGAETEPETSEEPEDKSETSEVDSAS